MKSKILISILSVITIFYYISSNNICTKETKEGVTAPEPPVQSDTVKESFIFKDFTITPLANFYVKARVLSKEYYNWGRESELSPIDLALGWDKMSDSKILNHIDIWQSGRWYKWKTKHPPISINEIYKSSSNMHIIPENKTIYSIIDSACIGDIVEFEGYLIKATKKDGWSWKSSLSRTDKGNGACELFFVNYASIIE